MPDFLRIYGVSPSYAELSERARVAIDRAKVSYPDRSDDCHTWRTLNETVGAVAGAIPDEVRVLCRESSSLVGLGVFVAKSGNASHEYLSFSRDPDRYVEVAAEDAPELDLELDVDVDTLFDVLDRASDDDTDGEGTTLRLPFGYRNVDAALKALARVAKHLCEPSPEMIVEVASRFYALTLDHERGARVEPLYVWHDDPAIRTWIRSFLPPPGPAKELRFDRDPDLLPPKDPARPLTTGSARSREEAARNVRYARPKDAGMTLLSSDWPPAPGAYDALLTALRASENAGDGYAEFRTTLHRYLVEIDPRRAHADLVVQLEVERHEKVRREIFNLLSRSSYDEGLRAIVRGLTTESEHNQRYIAEILNRSPRMIELTVREVLAPAWQSDRQLAKRVLHTFHEEYLRVPKELANELPQELVSKLGPLVQNA